MYFTHYSLGVKEYFFPIISIILVIFSSVPQRKFSLSVNTCMEFHFILRSQARLYTVLET